MGSPVPPGGGGPPGGYPGGAPVPFTPGIYQPNSTIAELILRAGQQRAESQQRMFEGLGNTVAQIGQIPAQMQQMEYQKQRLALEKARADLDTAKAARESGEYEHLQKMRGVVSEVLSGGTTPDAGTAAGAKPQPGAPPPGPGGPSEPGTTSQAGADPNAPPAGAAPNPVSSALDPDRVINGLIAHGADLPTIKATLADLKDTLSTKLAYRQTFKDMLGSHALGILPHIGTPQEAGAVQMAIDSLKEEGLPADKIAAFQDAYQKNPALLKNTLAGYVSQSEAAMKTWKEQQTKLGPGETVANTLFGPGGGGDISAPALPGTALGYLQAKYPGQKQFTTAQQAEAEGAIAEAKLTPEERNLKRIQAAKENLMPVDTVDEKGNPIHKFVSVADAQAMAAGTKPGVAKMPPTAVLAKQDAARKSIEAGENLLAELKDPQFTAAIGPVMGRFNSLKAAVGAGDVNAQYLVGALKSFSALQPAVHGFRATAMAQDIEKLINTKQTPEALSAGLKGILSASYLQAGETGQKKRADDPLGIR